MIGQSDGIIKSPLNQSSFRDIARSVNGEILDGTMIPGWKVPSRVEIPLYQGHSREETGSAQKSINIKSHFGRLHNMRQELI